jgi:Ca2+-binding RTX toxin-like protein
MRKANWWRRGNRPLSVLRPRPSRRRQVSRISVLEALESRCLLTAHSPIGVAIIDLQDSLIFDDGRIGGSTGNFHQSLLRDELRGETLVLRHTDSSQQSQEIVVISDDGSVSVLPADAGELAGITITPFRAKRLDSYDNDIYIIGNSFGHDFRNHSYVINLTRRRQDLEAPMAIQLPDPVAGGISIGPGGVSRPNSLEVDATDLPFVAIENGTFGVNANISRSMIDIRTLGTTSLVGGERFDDTGHGRLGFVNTISTDLGIVVGGQFRGVDAIWTLDGQLLPELITPEIPPTNGAATVTVFGKLAGVARLALSDKRVAAVEYEHQVGTGFFAGDFSTSVSRLEQTEYIGVFDVDTGELIPNSEFFALNGISRPYDGGIQTVYAGFAGDPTTVVSFGPDVVNLPPPETELRLRFWNGDGNSVIDVRLEDYVQSLGISDVDLDSYGLLEFEVTDSVMRILLSRDADSESSSPMSTILLVAPAFMPQRDFAVDLQSETSDYELTIESGQVIVRSVAGGELFSQPVASVSSLTFTGTAQAEQLRVSGDISNATFPVTVFAGGGNDLIDLTGWPQTVSLSGGGGSDSLTGGNGSDVLLGGAGGDWLDGGVGNDSLSGQSGRDTLSGGAGNDRIDGGAGLSVLDETGDSDLRLRSLQGSRQITLTGLGNDRFAGRFIAARLTGGSSDNRLDVSEFRGAVTLQGDGGNDTLIGGRSSDVLSGGTGNDVLNGNDGNDTLQGQDGNDKLLGGAGFDELFGGSGSDTLRGHAGDDLLSGGDGDDLVIGGNGSDFLIGGDGQDVLNGGNGEDTLLGQAGNDTLLGGANVDLLLGGEDNDTLRGQGGRDHIAGGPGADRFFDNSREINEAFSALEPALLFTLAGL